MLAKRILPSLAIGVDSSCVVSTISLTATARFFGFG